MADQIALTDIKLKYASIAGSPGAGGPAPHPRRERGAGSVAGSLQGDFPCEEDSLHPGRIGGSGRIAA